MRILLILAVISSSSFAREVRFDQTKFYYELAYEAGLMIGGRAVAQRYENRSPRENFPTQKMDDYFTKKIHGGEHTSTSNKADRRYDYWSDYINDTMKVSIFLSPLLKPEGHRLGTLFTIIHAQNTWFFMNRSLKVLVRRPRPKSYYMPEESAMDTSSFPSGHAGQAFLIAAIADRMFKLPLWATAGLYSLATTTALLRVAADRHFFSDSLVGGAMGYLGAWIAYEMWEEGDDSNLGGGNGVQLEIRPDRFQVSYRF